MGERSEAGGRLGQLVRSCACHVIALSPLQATSFSSFFTRRSHAFRPTPLPIAVATSRSTDALKQSRIIPDLINAVSEVSAARLKIRYGQKEVAQVRWSARDQLAARLQS